MVGRYADARRARLERGAGTQSRPSRVRRRSGALVVALGLLAPMVAAGGAAPAGAGNLCQLDPVTAGLNGVDAPGSAENPYDIADAPDLDRIADCDGPGLHFRQTADLVLTGITYTTAVILGTFRGTYDGDGFEIRGLTIVSPEVGPGEEFGVGLFEALNGATVHDVRLVDVSITAASSMVGALAGIALGSTLRDIEVSVSLGGSNVVAVSGDRGQIGGLVGLMVESSVDRVRVEGMSVSLAGLSEPPPENLQIGGVGGVVGFAEDSVFVGVAFRGSVTSESDEVGGIAGILASTELRSVRAEGVVSAISGRAVGGLVGTAYDTAGLEDRASEPSVQEGGFDGTVTGRSEVGGVIGYISGGALEGVTAIGSVSALDGYAGGIVGSADDAYVHRAAFSGAVATTGSAADFPNAAFTGGIAGELRGSIVLEVVAFGSVISTGEQTGGIVGQMRGGAVADASALVTVSGVGPDLGGIAGILVAMADGDRACPADLALIGDLDLSSGAVLVVSRTWSAATDSAGADIPLAGRAVRPNGGAADCLRVVDSFWESAGPVISIAGSPRTPTQMRAISTYTDTADAALVDPWPIVAGLPSPGDVAPQAGADPVWGICPGALLGYPFLLWLAEDLTEEEVCSDDVLGVPPGTTTGGGAGPDLTCAPLPVTVGAEVTCTVTGGPVGGDILWRAAYNPVIAEGPVAIGADGRGTFTFRIPTAALGQVLTVELVEWAAPMALGTVQGRIPSSIPAGGGPASGAPLGAHGALALLLALVAWWTAAGRRTAAGPRPTPMGHRAR
jgi:hypothetical protein